MPYDRADLRQAMRARNIARLEEVLGAISKNFMTAEIAAEVAEARRLLGILKRMNEVRTTLQELKQTQLAQLTGQKSPPPILLAIMTAVCVVMGTPESKLQDWSAVQAQLGRGARANFAFIKKVVGLDAAFVDVKDARRAQQMLSRYYLDVERVQAISEVGAIFYNWLSTITEEVVKVAETADS